MTLQPIDLGALAQEIQSELRQAELRVAELRGQLQLIQRLALLSEGSVVTEGEDAPGAATNGRER